MKKFIKDITKQASQIVLEKFGKVGVKYTKENVADVVTEADLLANDIIVNGIKEKYPEHGIISEERGEHQVDAEYVWIIDPIDGTRNFAVGTPLFGVMVGLARNGEMELATICDPVHDELMFAQKGQGAFMNGKKISCSQTKQWEHSFGSSGSRLSLPRIKITMKLLKNAQEQELFYINAFSSVAISALYVASGRRDWYLSHGSKIWDYAAPALIAAEAGCVVTDIEGQPWQLKSKSIIMANPHLHKKLLKIIKAQ